MESRVEKASIADAIQIHKLVNTFAERGEMLARPLSEIYENIRDFFVIRDGEHLLGTAALHITWANLAEVKSLAVSATDRHHGLGEALVQACLDEAREFGISSVFCLTYVPGFFSHCGFTEVDKSTMPYKVWGECYRCPKHPDCDETAMVFQIDTP